LLPASGPLAGHGGADYRVWEKYVRKSWTKSKNAFDFAYGNGEFLKTLLMPPRGVLRGGGKHRNGVWGHQLPSFIKKSLLKMLIEMMLNQWLFYRFLNNKRE
jgi:hypothetical protein